MEQTEGFIKRDSIAFETYKCTACGEELMNSRQLKGLADKYRQLRKAREITFATWGNSIAVRIPRRMVEQYRIAPGKHGLLVGEKEGMRIIPT